MDQDDLILDSAYLVTTLGIVECVERIKKKGKEKRKKLKELCIGGGYVENVPSLLSP